MISNSVANFETQAGPPTSPVPSTMPTPKEQTEERFMRFAQRYADANGLGYSQSQDSNQTEGADDQQA